MEINRELSRRVAHVTTGQPQSAWRTACQVLRSLAEFEEGFYVEGWAVTLENGLVAEHAWIELEGQVIDPTRWNNELVYFPVLRFDRRQIMETLLDCANLPVNWRGSVRLRDNPAYHRAWQNARALAQSQSTPKREAA